MICFEAVNDFRGGIIKRDFLKSRSVLVAEPVDLDSS